MACLRGVGGNNPAAFHDVSDVGCCYPPFEHALHRMAGKDEFRAVHFFFYNISEKQAKKKPWLADQPGLGLTRNS